MRRIGTGRIYLGMIGVGLTIGGLSLLKQSQLSYDAWTWVAWGDQIVHGHLHLSGGTSWKPLPVIFTTVFALFGSAAPNLWLLVTRAAAVVAVLMTIKLAARLAWDLSDGEENGRRRYLRSAPAVLAGAIALIGFLGIPTTMVDGSQTPAVLGGAVFGTSEALLIAAILIALERAYDGRHRQAFLIGLIPALDRPELWVVWLPYGVWQMRRDPVMRALVPGILLLALALWFVPQRLGGEDFTGGLSQATLNHSNPIQNASCPVCSDLKTVAWPLVSAQIRYTSLAAMFVAIPTLARLIGRRARWSDWTAAERASVALSTLAVAGWLWILGMVAETAFGLSGSQRYMLPGAELLHIASAAFFAWAAIAVARLFSVINPRERAAGRPAVRSIAFGVTLVALLFLLVPFWVGDRLASTKAMRRGFEFEAELRSETESALSAAGGHALASCGKVVSEALNLPAVSYFLHVPSSTLMVSGREGQIRHHPHIPAGQWPAVIVQDQPVLGVPRRPSNAAVARWQHESGNGYKVFRGAELNLYVDCHSAAARIPASSGD